MQHFGKHGIKLHQIAKGSYFNEITFDFKDKSISSETTFEEDIENIITKVFYLEKDFDILVIEDNSPDGTADIVKRLQKEFEQLHIIERKGKLGLGTAYISGFKWSFSKNC